MLWASQYPNLKQFGKGGWNDFEPRLSWTRIVGMPNLRDGNPFTIVKCLFLMWMITMNCNDKWKKTANSMVFKWKAVKPLTRCLWTDCQMCKKLYKLNFIAVINYTLKYLKSNWRLCEIVKIMNTDRKERNVCVATLNWLLLSPSWTHISNLNFQRAAAFRKEYSVSHAGWPYKESFQVLNI